MENLWSPWRYRYIAESAPRSSCIFCDIACSAEDEQNLVVHRARRNFVILNRYPYTSGHLMVVPFEHVASLSAAAPETAMEMMDLARKSEDCLRKVYSPGGLNIGMNIGESAGAGVASHIHLHVLPRWAGDVNFMTTISETRVIPEELTTTYRRIKDACPLW